jgi:hypothetical protein
LPRGKVIDVIFNQVRQDPSARAITYLRVQKFYSENWGNKNAVLHEGGLVFNLDMASRHVSLNRDNVERYLKEIGKKGQAAINARAFPGQERGSPVKDLLPASETISTA